MSKHNGTPSSQKSIFCRFGRVHRARRGISSPFLTKHPFPLAVRQRMD
jgi:hypothetical protein